MSSVKAQAEARFSQFAQQYVDSERHARGAELARLVELAQPQNGWQMLDVATGGGHMARTFAPHVRQVIATDLSLPMMRAAGQTIDAPNVQFVAEDAENLAFADASFDLVTCRIAPHHFPDVFRFVTESVRVLKPGGTLLVQDLTVPDDERAARYVDSFYRLRDPSHQRCYAGYEWQGMLLDAGLTVTHTEAIEHVIGLAAWVEQQACSPYVVERLHLMLKQAPDWVREHLRPAAVGTPDALYMQTHLIIQGRKQA